MSELVRVIEIRCPKCGPKMQIDLTGTGKDFQELPQVVNVVALRTGGDCGSCGGDVLIATEPVEEPRAP